MLEGLHQQLSQQAARQADQLLTLRNYLFGFYIVEFEQHGTDRAAYDQQLHKRLSIELQKHSIKGVSDRSLRQYRQFYLIYPQIWQTLSAKFKLPDFEVIRHVDVKGNGNTGQDLPALDPSLLKVAQEKFDFFTFNNICGRSGRMFQHFIGKVFLFHEQPAEELPLVDFPLFSQTKSVSNSLLIQMEENDLSEESKVRIQKFIDNRVLSIDTIKANSNIDPESQINLAQYIRDNYRELYLDLKWNSFPEYRQLKKICEIIWEYFNIRSTNSLITSGSQLAFRINRVKVNRSIKTIINEVTRNELDSEIINDNIEKVLDFIRTWCQFNFPKYLLALNNIQDEIFKELELIPGDYSFFAAQVECLFTEPMFTALDEYGIPLQTSDKLKYQLDLKGSLDDVLSQIKNIYTENIDVSPFEKDLINEAQKYF